MALIPISGVSDSWVLPGTYVQVSVAQGPSTASSGERTALYVMPMLSTGTWQANQIVQVQKESDAITGAGSGSPLHRALRMHLRANPQMKLYALPYDASSGSGATKADGYVDVSGTATASGILSCTIVGQLVTVGIVKGDTATVIGDNLAAAINAKTQLPCTASNSSGDVTITAKIAGASQGDGTIGVIRLSASVSSNIGITLSVNGAALGLGAGTAGVDGAVTEESNLSTALDAIKTRYYYIGTSLSSSSALTDLVTKVEDLSAPLEGKLCVGVSSTTDTLSSSKTLAVGQNDPRLQLVWMVNANTDNAELTANVLAVRQSQEAVDAAVNLDGFRTSGMWFVPPQDDADIPSTSDLNDAILDGLAPITTDVNGSYLVSSVTTKSEDDGKTVEDRRAADTSKVSVCDLFADTFKVQHIATYSGFKLKPDQLMSDGITVNASQKRLKKVITPSQYRPFVVSLVRSLDDAGLLENVDDIVSSIQVVIDPALPTRMEVGVNLQVIPLFHQLTCLVAETSTG